MQHSLGLTQSDRIRLFFLARSAVRIGLIWLGLATMNIRSGFYIGSIGYATLSIATSAWAQSAPANWSGPYVGAFAGYGWGQSSQHDGVCSSPSAPYLIQYYYCENGLATGDGHYGLSGGLGGALIGYNYQFNQFLVGVEADGAASGIDGQSYSCGAIPHTCGTEITADGNVRVRIGIPFDRFLPYVAGGLAIGRIYAYDDLFGTSGTTTRAGWTVGVGVEYKLTTLIGLRLEYLYSQFGTADIYNIIPGFPEQVSANTNVVRAAITFDLSPPPPPAPVLGTR
jgi:outer membrane immunogenic protein